MDLDALLRHYLGTDDLAATDAAAVAGARETVAIDFGVERDAGRRFALWTLLTVLGDAPDPREAFKDAATRDAAIAFARLMAAGEAADGAAT